MNNKAKFSIILIVCFFIGMIMGAAIRIVAAEKPVDNVRKIVQLNQDIHSCLNELNAYDAYYDAVETLLDSIGVDCDSPYLETDYGSNYLDAKYKIDSLYHKLPTKSI